MKKDRRNIIRVTNKDSIKLNNLNMSRCIRNDIFRPLSFAHRDALM